PDLGLESFFMAERVKNSIDVFTGDEDVEVLGLAPNPRMFMEREQASYREREMVPVQRAEHLDVELPLLRRELRRLRTRHRQLPLLFAVRHIPRWMHSGA